MVRTCGEKKPATVPPAGLPRSCRSPIEPSARPATDGVFVRVRAERRLRVGEAFWERTERIGRYAYARVRPWPYVGGPAGAKVGNVSDRPRDMEEDVASLVVGVLGPIEVSVDGRAIRLTTGAVAHAPDVGPARRPDSNDGAAGRGTLCRRPPEQSAPEPVSGYERPKRRAWSSDASPHWNAASTSTWLLVGTPNSSASSRTGRSATPCGNPCGCAWSCSTAAGAGQTRWSTTRS
jgi:hypothetical protein